MEFEAIHGNTLITCVRSLYKNNSGRKAIECVPESHHQNSAKIPMFTRKCVKLKPFPSWSD